MTEFIGFFGAFLGTLAVMPPLLRRAPGWGLIDVAAGRKVHEGEVPVVGGLVMGLVFVGAYLALGMAGAHVVRGGLLLGVSIVLVGGVLDDRFELRSLAKFGFQIAAALALVQVDGTVLAHLGQLLTPSEFTLGTWGVPLTVFAIVGVMNALNMADGIDGLAGTLGLLGFLAYGALAALCGETQVFVVACIACGTIAGFLCFNLRTPSRPRAAVFMGDTGSHFLGLLLAWCAIRLHNAEPPGLNAVTAGWILGVVLGDTLCVMVRRALRGRSPFHGDREHLHHLLLGAGLTVSQTVAAIALLSAAAGAIAVTAERAGVPGYRMFYAYLVLLVVYGLAVERIFRKRRTQALQA